MYNLYKEDENTKKIELVNKYENFLDGFESIIKLNKENPIGLFHLIKEGDSHPYSTIASLKDNFVYDFERVPDEHINILEIVSTTNQYNFIQIFIKPETEKISKLKYFADTTPSNKFDRITIETNGVWGETRKVLADMLFIPESKLYLWCNNFKVDIPYDEIHAQLQMPMYLHLKKNFDENYTPAYWIKKYEEEITYYNIKRKDYLEKIRLNESNEN